MSEVLGDAEPHHEPDDSDADDLFADGYDEFDEGFDDGFREPRTTPGALLAVVSAGSLAIASLVLAGLSLLAPFVGFVATQTLQMSHAQSPLFGGRTEAIAGLIFAAIAAVLAGTALMRAEQTDDPVERRLPRVIAGAAVLLVVVSVLQAVVSLIIIATTHLDSGNPFG